MLRVEKFIDEIGLVVVVDNAQDADDAMIAANFLVHSLSADHGPKRVGAVRIETTLHLVIDQLEDIVFD